MKKHLQKAELNDRPLKMEYCHELVVIGERAGDVRRLNENHHRPTCGKFLRL